MEDVDGDIGITKAAPNLLKQFDRELATLTESQETPSESQVIAIKSLLDPFQNTPQLLDSHLEKAVQRLTKKYLECQGQWLCEVLYTLCKVRGAKVVSRFFPSDAPLAEEVLGGLESGPGQWEQRYVLLLWMCILVLAPFSLETFGETFSQRVYDTALKYLAEPGKERDASALLMARLCMREDTKNTLLPQFFQYLKGVWGDEKCTVFTKIGVLQSSAIIWRIANPRQVEPQIEAFLALVTRSDTGSSMLYQKLLSKNLGRVALVQLALAEDEVPESVETIIGELMEHLGNHDSTVRHTASKAVARVVAKLDSEMQEQVAEAVLALFDENIITVKGVESLDRVSCPTWHGALLCLAEMLRRRLLLESHFEDISRILVKSLSFEQKRLTSAVGANVRDASCYVAWSLFRVYKNVPKTIVQKLLNGLVSLCCFDREVNIRRAASAAIQEGIGRQGDPVSLERGLALIQLLDYFNIGRRNHAYLQVSQQAYELGYKNVAADVIQKIDSWDPDVRRLASKALRVLNRDNCAEVGQKLVDMFSKIDFEMQHGVLVGLGELMLLQPLQVDKSLELLEGLTENELTQENEVVNCEGFLHLFSALQSQHAALSGGQQQRLQELGRTKLLMSMKCSATGMILDDSKLVAGLLSKLSSGEVILGQLLNDIQVYATSSIATAALGSISAEYDATVRQHLVQKVRSDHSTVEAKRDCLTSLGKLVERSQSGSKAELDALLSGMGNYTTDSRGDVGSWVRAVAIDACSNVCAVADEDFRLQMVNYMLKISGEVLDRMRFQACNKLLVWGSPDIQEILSSLPEDSEKQPKLFFPVAIKLLAVLDGEQLQSFLRGYVASCGAAQASTDTLVESLSALVHFLMSQPDDFQQKILKQLLQFVNVKTHGAKLTINALKTWSGLFQSGYELPEAYQTDQFYRALYARAFNTSINTRHALRILSCVSVFEALAAQGYSPALLQLTKLCQHQLIPVRTQASESLYSVLSMHEDPEVVELLEAVDWDDPVSSKDHMDQLRTALSNLPLET